MNSIFLLVKNCFFQKKIFFEYFPTIESIQILALIQILMLVFHEIDFYYLVWLTRARYFYVTQHGTSHINSARISIFF